MADSVDLSLSPKQTLVLKHSRFAAIDSFLSKLLWLLFFLAFYFYFFYNYNSSWTWTTHWLEGLVLLVIAIALVIELVRVIRICLGLSFSFDRATRSIKKNKTQIATFEEVDSVLVQTLPDGDTSAKDEYAIILKLKNQKKLRIAVLSNRFEVAYTAGEIAEWLGVTFDHSPVAKFAD